MMRPVVIKTLAVSNTPQMPSSTWALRCCNGDAANRWYVACRTRSHVEIVMHRGRADSVRLCDTLDDNEDVDWQSIVECRPDGTRGIGKPGRAARPGPARGRRRGRGAHRRRAVPRSRP